jgi:phosphoenolpyruvate synthase/pyruvate phosphate dikinase
LGILEVDRTDIAAVGGKGANLGGLFRLEGFLA